jgi:hypothetical protein
MAIVLVVIGLLLVVTLPFFTEKIGQEKIFEGRGNVDSLKREIIGFALTNGYLPTLSDVEAMANSVDAWDRRIAYWSDPDITGSGNDVCSAATPLTKLDVRDESLQTPATFDEIAFLIASPGPNFNLQVGDTGSGSYPTQVTTYGPEDTPADQDHSGSFGADYDITGTRQERFDDIVEYVSFNFLYDRLGCSDEDLRGADISFDQDMADFDDTTVSASNTPLGPTIQIDYETNTITMQNEGGNPDTYGCIFYTGLDPAGNCTEVNGNGGVCQFGDGIRAFFREETERVTDGGFTFAVIGVNDASGVNDTSDLTELCGGQCGRLGYAGSFTGNIGIKQPKLGVVFDFYGSPAPWNESVVFPPLTTNDHNHMSFVYWRNSGIGDNPDDEDIYHSNSTDGLPDSFGNPTAPGTFRNKGTVAWMEDGDNHPIRIDIYRNATAVPPFVTVRTWYDCIGQNCTVLTRDFDPTGAPEDPASYDFRITHNATDIPLTNLFEEIRFGWTMGDCGGGEGIDVKITDFGLAFR